MKLFSCLLLLAGASPCMSARWGDYLDKLLRSAERQVPLPTDAGLESHVEDLETVVAQRVWNVTSENWLSLPEARDGADDETPVKWLYYFTSSNENGTRNATFWDGVFEETVYALSKDKTGVKFGKADCATDASKDLCMDFYFTSQSKIPQFYHLLSYPDKTIEIRELPWNYTTIEIEDQVNHFTQFYTSNEWETIGPWTGVFNPINGALKDVRPYAAQALAYYEAVPQWLTVFVVSMLGRTIMTRLSKRTMDSVHAAAAPPRAAAPPKAEAAS